MSYNNGIIGGNVTIPDLRAALNTSATDVVTLCKHPSINRYSRFKPYPFGGILPNGLYNGEKNPIASTDPNSPSNKLIIQNNFGMTPTAITMPTSDNDMSGVVTKWVSWRPPSGKRKVDAPSQKEDEPCRMGDFLGYDSNAKSYIQSYEIFGDIGDGFFTPIRNGMMGVRLIVNSKTGVSILPSEFNWNGVPFSSMRLTIIIANLEKKGRFLYVQSEKDIFDASVESFMNTETKTGKIEARMDLAYATAAQINEFLNGGTKLFMAVGLAQEVEPLQNWNAKSVGNATFITTGGTTLPFDLVNFNMWDENWTVAKFCNFILDINKVFSFNLPCSLYAGNTYPATVGFDNATHEVTVSIAGVFQITPIFDESDPTKAQNYYTDPNTYNIAEQYKGTCNLGLRFTVDIYPNINSSEPIHTAEYGVFMTTGYNDARELGDESLSANAFYPFQYYYNSIQRDGCEYFGLEQLPEGRVIRIPYNGDLTYLWVNVTCRVICFPYRDVDKFVRPAIVAIGNNVIEKSLNGGGTQITVS